MKIVYKEFINDYVKKQTELENFNLALEKINDLFISILNNISEKLNNRVSFKLNLIGEHSLNSNYGYYFPIHILIDYFSSKQDYENSEKRTKKGVIGKLYHDAFTSSQNLILTIEELSKTFFNELSLKAKNAQVYYRKNQIAIKFFDYKFFIFFVNRNLLEDENYNFVIKGKRYSINLEKTTENLLEKNKKTNGNFFNLVKFFKVMELELSLIDNVKVFAGKIPYFYENLLYNIPNEILNNEYIVDNFIATIAYLTNCDKNALVTADNDILLNDYYAKNEKPYISTIDFNNVIKQSKYFLNNIDKIFNNNVNE